MFTELQALTLVLVTLVKLGDATLLKNTMSSCTHPNVFHQLLLKNNPTYINQTLDFIKVSSGNVLLESWPAKWCRLSGFKVYGVQLSVERGGKSRRWESEPVSSRAGASSTLVQFPAQWLPAACLWGPPRA